MEEEKEACLCGTWGVGPEFTRRASSNFKTPTSRDSSSFPPLNSGSLKLNPVSNQLTIINFGLYANCKVFIFDK